MTLPPGTRVRLVAPSPLMHLELDTGTVVGPAEWGGHVLVRLDWPAEWRHAAGRWWLETIREAEDNLEVVG